MRSAPSRASTMVFTSATVADAPTCKVSVRPAPERQRSTTATSQHCKVIYLVRCRTRPDENLPWRSLTGTQQTRCLPRTGQRGHFDEAGRLMH